MKHLPATILFLLMTFSGICQTPFATIPDKGGNFRDNPDTNSLRVPNDKLRILIKAREAGKLCILDVRILDSLEKVRLNQIVNLRSEIAAMQQIDAHSVENIRLLGEQVNELNGNNLLYKKEVMALQKEVKQQVRSKKFISVGGSAAILFLSYILITK